MSKEGESKAAAKVVARAVRAVNEENLLRFSWKRLAITGLLSLI